MKVSLFRYELLLMVFIVLAAGCSNQHSEKNGEEAVTNSSGNPFEVDEEETVMMGSISHGYDNPELDEKEEIMLPLSYDGGELVINYSVSASGKAKNVGFLVYVDGIAQPYKLNTTDSPYEYMHILDLEEDDKDTPFMFVFTPVTGKKGDTVNVTITSVYNASFIPDMEETTSYGGYHETLETTRQLVFNKDADPLDNAALPAIDGLSDVRLSTEPVTEELMERLGGIVMTVDLETLEKNVFTVVDIENKQDLEQNFQVNDSGTLPVTFKILGHPGVRFQTTFYLNHQALTTKDGDISFETELTKGDVYVLDVELDLEKLDDFNTFYAVSVPVNPEDFYDDVVTHLKTSSILLYK
ncbi:hypothetical protein SAMN05421736_1346 [Evansella caseinilytica]|uniref:Beta-glucanase/beta-glucan synthetase n=1 Tax=Evansella caseinilytica TaxID=1503961 RepID=A0A1H3V1B3_9BACI|nr:beta-glucanase/beta-glucan synthetase [Evansella caseinilytica]SDZ68336.1 hypothetical protein SAMN05421736_1346 [Evansella caseinilytica]